MSIMNTIIIKTKEFLGKIKMPKITLPKMPKITIPKIKMPKIKLPKIKFKKPNLEKIKPLLNKINLYLSKILNISLKLAKGFISWFWKAVKESIAQVWTLLGFFIAWLTLTGTAQQIVGLATILSTIIWLITIPLREEKE